MPTGLRAKHLAILLSLITFGFPAIAQNAAPRDALKLYKDLRSFQLGGGSVAVENLVLTRDRGEMTFSSGTIYFAAPVAGHIYGAVFIGEGKFKADPPPVKFEQEVLKSQIHAETLESDFKTAVLRFTDDTFDVIGKGIAIQPASADAQKLAGEFEGQFTQETGGNVAARLTVSLANNEKPGFFVAQFDKGKRGRFTLLFDPQGRIPSEVFDVNGGEKGMILAWTLVPYGTHVWMAFYSQDDYARGRVEFSDTFDQVVIRHHDLDMDFHDVGEWLRYEDKIDLESSQDGLRVVQFQINGALNDADGFWHKHALYLKYVKGADGASIEAVQEEADKTVTVFLPAAASRGQKLTLALRFEGQHMEHPLNNDSSYFPISDDWYPLHGYLQRSSYRVVFHHSKRYTPVTLGEQIQETPDGSGLATEWRMDTPIPFFKFAIGDYKRYDTTGKTAQRTVPVQFYGIQNGVKTDFVAAEMANALQYYSLLYGPFPYSGLHAVYNYRAYGQGMATMLLLAGADQSERYTYSFISHEVAHQWWGDMVAWRSYRDQWLSEGFAEYSSFLYTGQRDSGKARQELIDVNRDKLRATVVFPGIGSMRVADIGPLILGHRLGSGYYPLTYEKGALVLRMLHFLFTDPATLDDKPFFEMMAAFVKDHNGGAASTEDFIASANQRFAETAIAKKYRLADLNWFFQEWVYAAELPSYRFVYQLKPQPDGSTLLTGTLFQDGLAAGDKWFMPLPLVMTYGKDKVARGTVAVLGPQTPINIKLPSMPEKVELDPDMFVLSLKTSAVKEH